MFSVQNYPVFNRSVATLVLCLMLSQWIIDGCSNKTVDPPEVVFPTADIDGEVDTTEIGGVGLNVISVWDEESVVSDSGKFNVTVSDSAAQLLLLKDGNEALRAFAISVPGGSGKSGVPVEFSAKSTALSILMLTPGLLEAERSKAVQRMQELEELSSFPVLESRLRELLGSSTLAEALDDSLVSAAFKDCVDEWGGNVQQAVSSKTKHLNRGSGHFATAVLNSMDPARIIVGLFNKVPRDINVYRRTIGTDGRPIETKPILFSHTSMPGPDVASFFLNPGANVKREDTVDLRCAHNIAGIQYWTTGVGRSQYSQTPPDLLHPDFEQHYLDVAYTTMLKYLVGPFISILSGTLLHNVILSWAGQRLSQFTALIILLASDNEEEARAALQALFIEMIKTLVATAIVLGLGGLPWVLIGQVITLISIVISSFTIIGAFMIWNQIPHTDMHYVPNPIVDECDDEVPPAAVTDLIVLGKTASSVTLGFTMTGDDGNLGQASTYDIRHSSQMITVSNWDSADDPTGEPPPPAPGQPVAAQVSGLQPETEYFFATRVSDEIPNWSGLSNVVSVVTDTSSTMVWNVTFIKSYSGFDSTGLLCGYWPPCYWCPSEPSVYFLRDSWPVSFYDMMVTISGDSIHHSSTDWPVEGADFGSFTLSTASMEIDGSVGDSSVSFRMVFHGTLLYSDLFAAPGPFEAVFTVNDARLDQGQYVGNFRFEGSAQRGPGSCVNFDYSQVHHGGSVTVSWTHAKTASPFVQETHSIGL